MSGDDHGHDHGHDHGPGHAHGRGEATRNRLALTLVLVVGYTVAEVVGGRLTNSLALLADAGHMFSDAAALALSLFALWIARRPAVPRRSYGYYRAEILAALVNGATLLAVSFYIVYEAYERLWAPPEVLGGAMAAVAAGGLAVNLVGLALLHGGRAESLNLRGAWLHLLTDALGSVAAIGGALLVWAFGWNWADPVASALIGLLVVHSAWALVRESVAVLMESAPGRLDVDAVRAALLAVPDVREVHDLHVWEITTGMAALSCHARVADVARLADVLRAAQDTLRRRFGIDHTTIQVEPADGDVHPAGGCALGTRPPAPDSAAPEGRTPCPPASKTTPSSATA